jgi:copper(I)-binding protein
MRLLAAAVLIFFAVQSEAKGDLEVREAWSRATAPGAKVAAGYLEIRNSGAQPDRLLSASTGVAQRVELHVTQRDGDVMRMRQVKELEIPARGRTTLEPGGAHLMLVDIARPLKKGERVPLKLRFERSGELEVELEVREIGASHHRH